MTPIRIQLKRTKGWRLPANTIVVSRPSKWGNPFPVNKDQNVFQAVDQYRQWLLHSEPGYIMLRIARTELRGKNLACWCNLGSPCHADVLLVIANA